MIFCVNTLFSQNKEETREWIYDNFIYYRCYDNNKLFIADWGDLYLVNDGINGSPVRSYDLVEPKNIKKIILSKTKNYIEGKYVDGYLITLECINVSSGSVKGIMTFEEPYRIYENANIELRFTKEIKTNNFHNKMTKAIARLVTLYGGKAIIVNKKDLF